jgi:hypothetical protein
MVTDFRKTVNRISIPQGWEAGAITSKRCSGIPSVYRRFEAALAHHG